MKSSKMFFLLATTVLSVTGCARISTQVVDKPRVDQDLQGNRGYLAGTAPSGGAERKATRQVVETDIELPTSTELTPWKIRKASPAPAAVQEPVARTETPSKWEEEEKAEAPNEPEEKESEPSVPVVHHEEAPAASTVYTVRQGDTLEKIAAKVYGDSTQWRRIFKANKAKLKSPNRIYAGQRLVIPVFEKARHRAHEVDSSDIK